MNKLASVQLGDDEEGCGREAEQGRKRNEGRVGGGGKPRGNVAATDAPFWRTHTGTTPPPRRKKDKGSERFFCLCVAFYLGHPCF